MKLGHPPGKLTSSSGPSETDYGYRVHIFELGGGYGWTVTLNDSSLPHHGAIVQGEASSAESARNAAELEILLTLPDTGRRWPEGYEPFQRKFPEREDKTMEQKEADYGYAAPAVNRDGSLCALDTQLDRLEGAVAELAVRVAPVTNTGPENPPHNAEVREIDRTQMRERITRLDTLVTKLERLSASIDL